MLLEKLLLTGLLVFAGRGTIFQCVGACFVANVFLAVHMRTWPYEERNSNVLRAFAEASRLGRDGVERLRELLFFL